MKLTVKLPNFSTTKGSIEEVTGPSRLQRLVRWVRTYAPWIAAGAFFFLLFAWLSIPTKALAWRISHEAKSRGLIVDVEDLSISPFGSVTLENVAWTFEPSRPDTPPSKFWMEEVEIDVSLLSLMVGNIDVEVENVRDEGRLYARYQKSGNDSSFAIKVEELPLYDVPKAAQALNAPLLGLVRLDAQLELPENKLSQAEGTIEIECSACMVGDGETKLYVPGSKGLKDGVTIPQIDMGTLTGKLVVEKGKARIEEAIETESDDLWLEITGGLDLEDPFGKSRFDLVLKVRLKEALQERSERIRILVQTASPKVKLEAPEDGLGYRLGGFVARPKFRGINSKTRRERAAERRKRIQEREARRRARRNARNNRGNDDADRNRSRPDTDRDDRDSSEDGGEDPPTIGQPLNIQPLEPEEPPEPPSSDEQEEPPPPPGDEPPPDDRGEPEPMPEDEEPIEVYDEEPQDDGGNQDYPEEPPPDDGGVGPDDGSDPQGGSDGGDQG